MGYNPKLLLFTFFAHIVPVLVNWEPLQIGFFFVGGEHFLFSGSTCCSESSCTFPSPALESPFFQAALVSFAGE